MPTVAPLLVAIILAVTEWPLAQARIDFGSASDAADATITPALGENTDIHGIHVGYDAGDIVWSVNQWGGATNPGEFGLTGTFISQRHNVGDRVTVGETNNGIACDDDATGRGYIMYSEDSVHTRFADFPPHAANADHFVCVVYARGQWMYDDNEGEQGAVGVGGDWTVYPFTPAASDILVARVDFGTPADLGDSTVTLGAGEDEEVRGSAGICLPCNIVSHWRTAITCAPERVLQSNVPSARSTACTSDTGRATSPSHRTSGVARGMSSNGLCSNFMVAALIYMENP